MLNQWTGDGVESLKRPSKNTDLVVWTIFLYRNTRIYTYYRYVYVCLYVYVCVYMYVWLCMCDMCDKCVCVGVWRVLLVVQPLFYTTHNVSHGCECYIYMWCVSLLALTYVKNIENCSTFEYWQLTSRYRNIRIFSRLKTFMALTSTERFSLILLYYTCFISI